MSETISGRTAFSLREVALGVQQTIQERHSGWIWVKAEMNKLNLYPHSGHAYPELVEKQDGRIVAQMRGNLWKEDYNRINHTFLEVLKEPLKDGITIFFQAKITFDPVYGLALRILDIDPSYSLGELEREKQQTIATLKKEGIFEKNKQTFLPLLPQRIAIISVETSKGYSDFTQVIAQNPWGYRFFLMLFPAILQGDQAAEQIIAQLSRIRKAGSHFDLVAIIRGGGGDVGLSCYNNLALAREVALFPLPVVTGIGHSTNETVTEMVAYRNAITPTELADLLIQNFHNFSVPVKEAEKTIGTIALHLLSIKRTELSGMASLLGSVVRQRLSGEQREVDHIESTVRLTDPIHVLKRGYSITFKNGRPVTHPEQVEQGDEIETRLHEGTIRSIIK
jgi:exodeoxyribonuclease VII large subunit